MVVQNIGKEIIIRLSNKIKIDDLQDIADWLQYKELSKKSAATQNDADKLVKSIKKNRWRRTKALLQK